MKAFDRYACVGDYVEWDASGFTLRATVHHDSDSRPEDCDCFDPEDSDHGAENREILQAWRDDEWFYCGIIVSAYRNNVLISEHAASLWGIECNFPNSDNSYLAEVARELESEAIDAARIESARIVAALTE